MRVVGNGTNTEPPVTPASPYQPTTWKSTKIDGPWLVTLIDPLSPTATVLRVERGSPK